MLVDILLFILNSWGENQIISKKLYLDLQLKSDRIIKAVKIWTMLTKSEVCITIMNINNYLI